MRVSNLLFALGLGMIVAACDGDGGQSGADSAAGAKDPLASLGNSERLVAVLTAQPTETRSRYRWRHPQETLEFFGITPGMTVVEVLPGGGWYSGILIPYLGEEGHLIGADYPLEIWPNFEWVTDEWMQRRLAWPETWMTKAAEWRGKFGASAEATRLGDFTEAQYGTVDAVLFIRALHNLKRFNGEEEGEFLNKALEDTVNLLKPGGIVGVVQHRAPDEMDDQWADGSRGYLKKIDVISIFEDAGLQLVEQSQVNANPADTPGEDDIVWRLPPSLSTSKDDPELRAQYEAIGESNRMTLLFRKPVY